MTVAALALVVWDIASAHDFDLHKVMFTVHPHPRVPGAHLIKLGDGVSYSEFTLILPRRDEEE